MVSSDLLCDKCHILLSLRPVILFLVLLPITRQADTCFNSSQLSVSCRCVPDVCDVCSGWRITCELADMWYAHMPVFNQDYHEGLTYTLTIERGHITVLDEEAWKDLHINELRIRSAEIGALDKVAFGALRSDLVTLEMSDNGLTELPTGSLDWLTGVTLLNISNNRITEIEGQVFDYLSSLQQLVLQNNQITVISPDAFGNLVNLVTLVLSRNNIKRLHARLFDYIGNVRSLVLRENQISDLPEGIFHALIHLTTLDLSMNHLTELDANTFSKNTQLQSLYLDGNYLRSVTYGHFSQLSQIRVLYLHNNWLEDIRGGTFASMPKLRRLPLYNNHLTELPEGLFYRGGDDFYHIDLSNNYIRYVDPRVFDGLPGLKNIYFSNNSLTNIPHEVFRGLSRLKVLLLDNNQLSFTADDVGMFQDQQNLNVLVLSNNNMSEIPDGILKGPNAFRDLSFSCNKISRLKANTFMWQTSIVSLNLSDNSLEYLPMDTFSNTSITTLDLGGNKIQDINDDVLSLPSLTSLILENNYLTSVTKGMFSDTPNLSTLNLDNNYISYIEPGAFSQTRYYQMLSLSGNILASVHRGVFHGGVQHLSLSNNSISWIEPGAFQLLEDIIILDLSGNNLTEIQGSEFVTSSHPTVDLRGNHIRCLSPQMSKTVWRHNQCQMSLCLQDNPLDCSCHMAWLQDSRVHDCLSCDLQWNKAQCSNEPLATILNFTQPLNCPAEDSLETWYCPEPVVAEPSTVTRSQTTLITGIIVIAILVVGILLLLVLLYRRKSRAHKEVVTRHQKNGHVHNATANGSSAFTCSDQPMNFSAGVYTHLDDQDSTVVPEDSFQDTSSTLLEKNMYRPAHRVAPMSTSV